MNVFCFNICNVFGCLPPWPALYSFSESKPRPPPWSPVLTPAQLQFSVLWLRQIKASPQLSPRLRLRLLTSSLGQSSGWLPTSGHRSQDPDQLTLSSLSALLTPLSSPPSTVLTPGDKTPSWTVNSLLTQHRHAHTPPGRDHPRHRMLQQPARSLTIIIMLLTGLCCAGPANVIKLKLDSDQLRELEELDRPTSFYFCPGSQIHSSTLLSEAVIEIVPESRLRDGEADCVSSSVRYKDEGELGTTIRAPLMSTKHGQGTDSNVALSVSWSSLTWETGCQCIGNLILTLALAFLANTKLGRLSEWDSIYIFVSALN